MRNNWPSFQQKLHQLLVVLESEDRAADWLHVIDANGSIVSYGPKEYVRATLRRLERQRSKVLGG